MLQLPVCSHIPSSELLYSKLYLQKVVYNTVLASIQERVPRILHFSALTDQQKIAEATKRLSL